MQKKPPTSSPFVQSALGLEECFQEMEQLSGSLCRLELNSETALEKARSLLVKFSEGGEKLGQALMLLGQRLEERRSAVESAIGEVNARSPEIQAQFAQAEEKIGRFQQLGVKVGELTQAATGGDAPLHQVVERVRQLSQEAAELQEEARLANLRTLEKNAQNLRQNLRAIERKLVNPTGA